MNLGLGLRLGAGGGKTGLLPYLGLDGAPQFSLPGGIYDADTEAPINVAISHLSGGVKYSLNGADVDKSSQNYEGSIELTETTTIKARGWIGRIYGPIGQRTYKILPSDGYSEQGFALSASDELGWNSSDTMTYGRIEV